MRHFHEMTVQDGPASVVQYHIVLTPGFCLLSLGGALEVLRVLNEAGGQQLAHWQLHSASGGPVLSSTGIALPVNGPLPDCIRQATVVIVGGAVAAEHPATTAPLTAWLRRIVRRGVRVAGLHSAALQMARAGILTNRRATIHWRYSESLAEAHPEVDLRRVTYTMHDGIATASGGTTAIDLFLHLIELDHGAKLADMVAEQMNYAAIRAYNETCIDSVANRRHIRHDMIAAVVELMEQSLEDPLEMPGLARTVGLSPRQIERLFKRHLGLSPQCFYMQLRLARAHRLLCFSSLAISEVAVACGFQSLSHFSRQFRAAYGLSPVQLKTGSQQFCREPFPETA